MLVVTLPAGAMYLMLSHFEGSIDSTKARRCPDVDTTIPAVFRLGQWVSSKEQRKGNVSTS